MRYEFNPYGVVSSSRSRGRSHHRRLYAYNYDDEDDLGFDDADLYGQSRTHREESFAHLLDANIPCPAGPGWNMDYATAFLAEHLSVNGGQNGEVAGQTISTARYIASSIDPEEVIWNLFEELDEKVFADKLRGAVYLNWAPAGELDRDVTGITYPPETRARRVTILLNPDLQHCGSNSQILAALLHQMIHAYFLVTCGPAEENGTDGPIDHGLHFGKLMYSIRNLSGYNRSRCIPLHYSQRILLEGHSGRHRLGHHGQRSLPAPESWAIQQRNTCSHCHSSVQGPNRETVDAWYNKTCQQVISAPEYAQLGTIYERTSNGDFREVSRSQPGVNDSTTFVELLYNDKSYALPLEKLDSHESFQTIFATGNRYLEIPPRVPEDTFQAMFDFLYTGYYEPSTRDAQSSGYGRGPPIIKDYRASSPDYLRIYIRLFKLAEAIGFLELRDNALSRLNNLHVTHNDPIRAFTEIYSLDSSYAIDGPRDPSPALRTWTVDFLRRVPTNEYGRPLDSSNLDKVRSRPGWGRLWELGGPYHDDEKRAEEALRGEGRTFRQLSLAYNRNDPGQMLFRHEPPLAPAIELYGRPVISPTYSGYYPAPILHPIGGVSGGGQPSYYYSSYGGQRSPWLRSTDYDYHPF